MAPYRHHVNTYHRAKRARRIKKFSMFVLVIAVLGAGAIGVDWLLAKFRSDNGAVSIASQASVQSSTINIFRTPYFQFQADRTWREVEIDNNKSTYTYRSYNGNLVQHEINIVVNGSTDITLANESTTRTLPVEIEGNSLKAIGEISPHCKTLIDNKKNTTQQYVSYKDTEFPCNPDGSQFVVRIGQVEGRHFIQKSSPDGVRTFLITYRDSTFTPLGKPLRNIINSFQLL